jgi:ankyrin repeat protein
MDLIFNTIFTLITAGASVNTRSENGDTPLKLATRYCREPKIIELLLSAGAQKTPKQLNTL